MCGLIHGAVFAGGDVKNILRMFGAGIEVKVKKVKGCPDLRVATVTKGSRHASAVFHADGNINAQNQHHDEIYDGYDQQTAAQKIFEWLSG